MRLDKYLKVSRLIKRRTVAKEICGKGRIELNGRPAKAGSEVKPGDQLYLDMGRKQILVKVVETPEYAKATEAAGTYEIMEEKIIERDDLFNI